MKKIWLILGVILTVTNTYSQITTSEVKVQQTGNLTTINGNLNIPWPANSTYTFFGHPSLDHNSPGNYALLQETGNGTTYLNSPDKISFRINNQTKMTLTNEGISGVNFPWPANANFTFFGTPSIDQSNTGNYALLQEKNNGNTFLNSPGEVHFRINKQDKMILSSNGNIGIGTNSPSYELEVDGTIRATTFSAVSPPSWPDYVFKDEYELRTLEEVEQHVNENGHLPEIPSETEVTENGINLGEMNAKLLQKIEELTLYLIEEHKNNKELAEKVERLENELSTLKNE